MSHLSKEIQLQESP